MYKIVQQQDGTFHLMKESLLIGSFTTLEDAEKAQVVAEQHVAATPVETKTWVDDGKGVDYPEGTDDVHSGQEKLSGEARMDALLIHLREKHGFHVPWVIAPAEKRPVKPTPVVPKKV